MKPITQTHSTSHLKVRLLALFVTFLWSTSWVLIKLGLQVSLPPLTFAGLRYTLAFLCLLPFVLMKPSHRQSIRDFSKSTWLQLLLLGLVFYTFTQGAQFIGLAFLPAATVTLLLNFSPIFVVIPSRIVNKQATTFAQWMGILLSLAGAIIYFLPLNIPAKEVIGLTAVFVGVLSNASSSLLGKKINTKSGLPAIIITTIRMGSRINPYKPSQQSNPASSIAPCCHRSQSWLGYCWVRQILGLRLVTIGILVVQVWRGKSHYN